MTLDTQVLAERAAAVERHLARVAERLPAEPSELRPMTDETDAVVLHLWQAVQVCVDLAMSVCARLGLGAPATYAEAFGKLGEARVIDAPLASRLARAAGFRNTVAHAYEGLDLTRVFRAAKDGPADLRAFLAALRDLAAKPG